MAQARHDKQLHKNKSSDQRCIAAAKEKIVIPPLSVWEIWLCMNDAMRLINFHPCLMEPYLVEAEAPFTQDEVNEILDSHLLE